MHSNGYALQIACCASCTPLLNEWQLHIISRGPSREADQLFKTWPRSWIPAFPFHSAMSPYNAEPACKRGPRIRPWYSAKEKPHSELGIELLVISVCQRVSQHVLQSGSPGELEHAGLLEKHCCQFHEDRHQRKRSGKPPRHNVRVTFIVRSRGTNRSA